LAIFAAASIEANMRIGLLLTLVMAAVVTGLAFVALGQTLGGFILGVPLFLVFCLFGGWAFTKLGSERKR
jgi:hypothetical protein